jgi:flap endonuclease-1
MGIKLLNQFIKYTCKNTLKTVHLNDLRGKTICIDTHIYMYKFQQELSLIEGFYLLCNLFKKYEITPIFIWDGKTPQEKKEEIERRKKEKRKLTEKYYLMKENYEKNKVKDNLLLEKMEELKKRIVRIKHVDIENIKQLLDSYGITQVIAEGEADVLCAKMVLQKKAYACISDDMDLFVYGCPRVLRYLNLKKQTMCLYDTEKILKQLNISYTNFKTMCILCGTDYDNNTRSVFKLYKYYLIWKNKSVEKSYIIWIKENYCNEIDLDDFNKIFILFNIDITKDESEILKGKYNKKKLYEILELDNFIFP